MAERDPGHKVGGDSSGDTSFPATMQQGYGGFEMSQLYMRGFQGNADAVAMNLPADEIIRAPDQPCKYAQIFNWNAEDDGITFELAPPSPEGTYFDTENEIYYGFNGKLVGQVFAGANSGMFPIANLNQICLRARPGQTRTVWIAFWW